VERLGGIPIRAGYGQTWGELCQLVRETRPQTYIGFPAALVGLSRMYGDCFPVRRALVSADACPEGVMAELGRTMELYPHYGSRECGLGGAVTCPAFEGMHLRENHIIPEIIDETGKVLPDGAYGELVITTIGADAMPLIRYRTGDYTRLLPPCPCGGVTRRIDTVSRREGPVSMAELDSALFRVPGLVDHHASFDGTLRIRARCLDPKAEADLRIAAKELYPHLKTEITTTQAAMDHRPMYPGKRYIDQKSGPL